MLILTLNDSDHLAINRQLLRAALFLLFSVRVPL